MNDKQLDEIAAHMSRVLGIPVTERPDKNNPQLVDLVMRCTFGEVEELAKLAMAAEETEELADWMKLAAFVSAIKQRSTN
jgi:hypothetical protein